MARAPVAAKTPWFISHIMNPIFRRTGTFPVVTVRGRRTGKAISTPINVLELNGVTYLVSPRGETGWSRNLRVTGECSLKVKGQERRFRATEVPPAERAPILGGYLDKWGSQTRDQFEKLPDPLDHPTFRLDPV
jgi:deazaflavin-dependent oxidoreductase (nitroreductase family)